MEFVKLSTNLPPYMGLVLFSGPWRPAILIIIAVLPSKILMTYLSTPNIYTGFNEYSDNKNIQFLYSQTQDMSTLLWFYHIFTDLRRAADFWLLQSKLLWDGDCVYRLNHDSKNGHPMGEFSSSTLLLSGLILFKSISPCKHPIRSAQHWTYWISTDSRQCHIIWYCRQLRHFANFATYWASPSHYSRF